MVDNLEIAEPDAPISATSTHWLLLQAIELLNSPGERSEAGYGHVVELLRERDDATRMIESLLRQAPYEDVTLRWSVLYVAGDVGDGTTGELLARQALKSLPERLDEEGCEGPADGELLVRTMAVEALQQLAERHENAREHVLRIIDESPAQPVLIEAVKAARALDLDDQIREKLSESDRWMLDIDVCKPAVNIVADPERGDDGDDTRSAPVFDYGATAPRVDCRMPHQGK